MLSTCYNQNQISPGLPVIRPFCASRRIVAGQAGRFFDTATMKNNETPSESIARFWKNVDKTPNPKGCWLWKGAITVAGYGRFNGQGGRYQAHRMAYTLTLGEIPAGKELDHLCRVRNCVNPNHLEPVTHRENIRRGIGPIPENMVKTHCLRGHPLSGENVQISNGSRRCRKCGVITERRFREFEARRLAALQAVCLAAKPFELLNPLHCPDYAGSIEALKSALQTLSQLQAKG